MKGSVGFTRVSSMEEAKKENALREQGKAHLPAPDDPGLGGRPMD